MDNWLLILVAVIFFLCIVIGGIKGFFKISISVLSVVLTLVIVVFASPYVEDAIVKYTVLDEIVEEKCLEIFMPDLTSTMLEGKDLTGTPLEGLTASEIEEMSMINWDAMGMAVDDVIKLAGEFTQKQQTELIDNSILPQFMKNLLAENNNTAIYEELGVTYFAEYVAEYMSNMVVRIIAFLLTFIFAFVIIKALSAAVDIIGELPVLGMLNHAAGATVGVVQAVLIVWILFLIITLMYTSQLGRDCFVMIEESRFLSFLYDSNMILHKILKF